MTHYGEGPAGSTLHKGDQDSCPAPSCGPDESIGYAVFLEQVPTLTKRQHDHWTRKGYLKSDNGAPGSGHVRTWPASEVAVARLMVRLTDAGWFAEVAATIARAVAEGWIEDPRKIRIGPGLVLCIEDHAGLTGLQAPDWTL